jgi:hypothetical protein
MRQTQTRWLGVCALTLSLLGGLACGEGEEGPEMKPGAACLSCHRSGGKASEEAFTAAGTVYTDASGASGLNGATVTIIGSDNQQVTLSSNAVGNFYTRQNITMPYTVVVSNDTSSATMMSAVSSGNCNDCHSPDGVASARIHP